MILTDANQAVAQVAYRMSDAIPTYPITPATPMIDWIAQWCAEGKLNLEGMVPTQSNWQSEMGVAGALHGSLETGGLGTTFTASQGLLLMLPAMYRMAGSLLPHVIHVATRSVAKHSLSIFSDHTDIMSVQDSGYAFLGSTNVQEAQDMACIAHMATLKGKVPFLHFFDGFKTSHAIENISELTDEQLRELWPYNEVAAHRAQALNPENPKHTGTAQMGEEFFETRKSHACQYKNLPSIVDQCMDQFMKVTGRSYRLFDYYGQPDASHVFLVMASAAGPVQEAVERLNQLGHKTGVMVIRLFKPFSMEHFIGALPVTCSHLISLEAGSDNAMNTGPIYKEVSAAYFQASNTHRELELPKMKSVHYGLSGNPLCSDMVYGFFQKINEQEFGLPAYLDMPREIHEGNSAMDNVIFIHNKCRDFDVRGSMRTLLNGGSKYVQGNAHVTYLKNVPFGKVQLRWSEKPILENHLLQQSSIIIADGESMPHLIGELDSLSDGGKIYVTLASHQIDDYSVELKHLKTQLYKRNCELVILPATGSTIQEDLDFAFSACIRSDSNDPKISLLEDHNSSEQKDAFEEKQGFYIPDWQAETCVQCGLCNLVCPSGAIEVKAFDPSFAAIAPNGFPMMEAHPTLGFKQEQMFSIQVNANECDRCMNCVTSCPTESLGMGNDDRMKHWNFFSKIPASNQPELDQATVSQVQLMPSYYRNPISDRGSAPSVYLKLLSKLFGDSLLVANATGSSSIIAGTEGYSPWQKDDLGRGPVWSNSLFENNAEYGLGIRLQMDQEKERAKKQLKHSYPEWSRMWEQEKMDRQSKKAQRALISEWNAQLSYTSKDNASLSLKLDALVNKDVWIVGGDGWAYDIGFGGLDHVLSSQANVNILVLDNELYENTGGQFSKASPKASSGLRPKKDLGKMAMTYDHVYVASVSYGADPDQLLVAMQEAASYNGPSIILGYCHSEAHGIHMKEPHTYHKALVDSGAWLLYRRDPRKSVPLQLDSEDPTINVEDYLIMEGRFRDICDPISEKFNPRLIEELQQRIQRRYASFRKESLGHVLKKEWELA